MTNPKSVELLRQTYGETPLASGVARIKSRDKSILDDYQAVVGLINVAKGGINTLEADWIATTQALYYIVPRARHLDRFTWPEIRTVRIGAQKLVKATVQISLIGDLETIQLETSRSSAKSIVDIWTKLTN
jgi:hypothetical protein